MASKQQIEDDGALAFFFYIRGISKWNAKSYKERDDIEKAFDAGYKEGRKDG